MIARLFSGLCEMLGDVRETLLNWGGLGRSESSFYMWIIREVNSETYEGSQGCVGRQGERSCAQTLVSSAENMML